MRIIPVIDLKQGCVVRGVAGNRDSYQPIESILAADSSPTAVGKSLAAFGFSQVYVADLDALAGEEPDWSSLRAIANCGLDIWCDAGFRSPAEVVRFSAAGGVVGSRLIVALESLTGAESLARILAAIGNDSRPIFSLDLRGGEPVSSGSQWQGAPMDIACQAREIGFTSILVLDVASVGAEKGPSVTQLCRSIRERLPDVELISGGGVRDLEDLRAFYSAGCDGVLVASALHNGSLSREQIDEAQGWMD